MGDVMSCLRSGLKTEWIDSELPDNTAGWRLEWFYIVDQLPRLPHRTGHKPVKISKWDLGLSSRDIEDLKGVLELVSDLKKQGGDRSCSRQVILSAVDSVDQGPGSPHVRVIGAVRPHT
jgi:hypothetical protein